MENHTDDLKFYLFPDILESIKITYFAAKRASVFAVLCDFHFFHHFPKGGTVAGAIFTGNSDLLRAFGLLKNSNNCKISTIHFILKIFKTICKIAFKT